MRGARGRREAMFGGETEEFTGDSRRTGVGVGSLGV